MNLEHLAQIQAKRWNSAATGERLHGLCGPAASLVFFAGYLTVSAFQVEYQPLADTLSRMGRMGRSYSELMNLTLIVSGLLIGFFAPRLDLARNWAKRRSPASLFWAAFGYGLAGTGILPCDHLCGGDSLTNYMHTLPALVSVVGLLLGLYHLPACLPGKHWADIRNSSRFLAWGGLATLIAYLLGLWRIVRPMEPYIGVIEKSYVIVVFVFLLVLTRRLQKFFPQY
ncbi:MAG: DUF998 domain-containing protein [Anaerolineales bacterium]